MTLKKIDTAGLLECVNCGRHFKYMDMNIEVRLLYNVNITQKNCPYCGSHWIEPVEEQKRLDKYLYFSDKDIN